MQRCIAFLGITRASVRGSCPDWKLSGTTHHSIRTQFRRAGWYERGMNAKHCYGNAHYLHTTRKQIYAVRSRFDKNAYLYLSPLLEAQSHSI